MNGEWLAHLTTISAPLAGAVWGVSLAPDFSRLGLKSKLWRWFLAVLGGIFAGPYIQHQFFQEAHPSASTFWLFAISAVSLAVGPILVSRVMEYASRININLTPKDDK